MKISSAVNRTLLVTGIVGLVALAMPAFAQNAEKAQEELQRVIEAQQQQLEAQQKQLDAQRQLLKKLEQQMKSLVEDAETEAVPVATEEPAAKPPVGPSKAPPRQKRGIAQADKHDRDNPTGSDVTYFDPSLSVTIPGTNTDVGLHGFAEFQIIHDTTGLNNNEFDTIGIPVDGGPSQTKFSVNPTRLAIFSTTRIPTGQLNTVFSMDFNGELDRPEPRLRIAFGEWINDDLAFGVLTGQSFTTMLDLKAAPETLDFAGPTGAYARRQPLLRFTKAFDGDLIAEVAVETPENVAYIGAESRTRFPDLMVAGTWKAGGTYLSHLRLAGHVRDLRAKGTNGTTDAAPGWAIAGSGKLNVPFLGAKDNIKFTVQYGEGYGAAIKSGPPDAAFDIDSSELKTIGVFSTYGGLQHWWSDSLRTNLVYGYLVADNPGFLDGDELENTTYVAGNLVWNPYKTVTLGFEYLWGRRENKDGAAGTANRFLFSSRFDY